jgi:hypothetical protein
MFSRNQILLYASLITFNVATTSVTCTEMTAEPGSAPQSAEPVQKPANKPIPKTWIRVSPKRADYLVFVRPGEGFSGRFAAADDVTVEGTQGTVISTDNNQPILHNGAIVVNCRHGSCNIMSKLASVTVPAGVTALVDCVPSWSTVRVACISGSAGEQVTVRGRKQRQLIVLHPGQEVSVSDRLPATSPRKFDPNSKESSVDVSQLLSGAVHASGTPTRILGADLTEFRCSGPDTLYVRSGQILTAPNDKLIVQTPISQAVASKGAIIDVDADAETMRVKSFTPQGHVMAVCGEQTLDVGSGQEILLASHEITDDDQIPQDGVSRRKTEKLADLSPGIHGASCDFSITTYLNETPHAQPIRHAAIGEERLILDKMLKSAAAVYTVTQGRGVYSSKKRIERKRTPGPDKTSGGSA